MTDWISQGYREMQPGVFHRVADHGAKLMVCEIHMATGASVAPHAHPHEQMSYVISGRVEFDIAGEKQVLGPGDSCVMTSNAAHGVKCLEDAFILDIFTPLREDFLK